eukprot:TRINITY_DN112321_c0_g1_i1.p1 TRINITY_DN112321_c0_g1~~TRINITY_DN112321_c0_g1_i1.p1  ORF type:complete len:463 (+),score=76.08 TRINITY_DN112321_c0_g1_i1:184-1389(+)
MADGWLWVIKPANASDCALILITGIIPNWFIAPIFGWKSNEIRIGQAIRCLRVVRAVRQVRTHPRLRILWMLINGMLDSARILLWTSSMMGAVLYIFSIFFVDILTRGTISWTEEQEELVMDHFGDVPKAMFTLFQIVTLDSWSGLSRPLQYEKPVVHFFFIMFISVAILCLDNLIIAVIVANALAQQENDEEMVAALAKEASELELEDYKSVFRMVDIDEGGSLDEDEYRQVLADNPSLRTKLIVMGLEEEEIDDLWNFVSFPPEVDEDSWAHNIKNLKGECRAKQSYRVTITLERLSVRLQAAKKNIAELQRTVVDLQTECNETSVDLRRALMEVRHFIMTVAKCVPPDKVNMRKSELEAFQNHMSEVTAPLMGPLPSHILRRQDAGRALQDFKLPGAA